MTRFTRQNTDYEYSASALAEMNTAFDTLCAMCPVSADSKSWQDHLAERVWLFYDQGWRGAELVRRVDQL